MDTYNLARELAGRLATERPDLLPALVPIVTALRPCRHGPGFASVLWHGTAYTFTATQAAIVRQLWKAWKNGTPDVRQETLILAAGSEASRVSDVFKGHPAWNALIIAGPSRGTYRLAEVSP